MKEWFFYWKKLVFIFITKNKWEKIEKIIVLVYQRNKENENIIYMLLRIIYASHIIYKNYSELLVVKVGKLEFMQILKNLLGS